MKTTPATTLPNCFNRFTPLRAMGLGLALIALQTGDARAALKTWVGTGGTGNWSTSANWSPSGAPAAGDDLSFPAGAAGLANTNNLTRNFSSIAFSGGSGGYILRGNPLTLTNGLTAAHTAGLNTVELTITNGASQTITATTGGTLALNGDIVLGSFTLTINNTAAVNLAGLISGTGNLVKNGAGNLLMNGAVANTYTGTTTVNNGTLELNDVNGVSVNMVSGDLTIGNSGTVLLSEGNQIADTADVTINGNGLLNLNNLNEAVASLTFGGSGSVTAGTGTLTNGNITATANFPTISGNLHLGTSTKTITVSSAVATLTISAVVKSGNSGSPLFIPAGFTKSGPGTLVLSGANTYGGPTTANDGTLQVNSTLALGASGTAVLFNNPTTIVNSNAVLLLNNAHITNEVLTLNSINPLGALQVNSTGDWIGNITLSTNVVIEASSLLQLGGVISGPGGFTKISPSTLRMVGTDVNTYAGTTTVNNGTLELGRNVFDGCIPGDLVIGGGDSTTKTVRNLVVNQIVNTANVTINTNGLLDLNGFLDGIASLDMTGGTADSGTSSLVLFGGGVTTHSSGFQAGISGSLNLGGAVRTFDVASGTAAPDLLVSAVISNGGVTQTGGGTLYFSGANTYSGLTTISNGFLEVITATGLGTTNAGTVLNGGSLYIGGVSVVNEGLTNNGSSANLFKSSGVCSWSGNITMNAPLDLVVLGTSLDLSGVISGSGAVVKSQSGTLIYSGGSANTYTNTTTVTAGTLQLSKTSVNGTILGELTVGGGGGGDTVQLTADNQIADTALIHVNSFGLLDLNSNTETTGAVDGAGQIDMGVGGTFRAGSGNGSSTFSGTIVGSGNLLKLGTGIWTLTGTNTYTANTTVSAGTLLVNGSQPQSPVTVNGTATIGGSGIIGNLFVFGSLKPGNSPGILTCSNFVCNSSSSDYFVELTGPVAGTDYDQLNVRGTNALASATLHLTTAFTTPVGINQTFTILNNDAAEAITGTFNGLAEGATISSGGYKFTISYTGGTGNDVQLNLTDVPAAEVSASVTAGNGNHAIDPNECNSLNLVITNKSGALMTGISATLSTTTGRVLITQPYSTYANIAANGKGTNTTPFQISTLPGFFCGTNITLQLIVDSSAGSFITSFTLPTGEVAVTPFRYDNNAVTAIPDIGSVDSATAVAAFSGPLEKVAVSLFITHPIDSDLNLSLVSPDGTIVPLTVGIGAGANFGSSSNDVNRTTFDDAAATAITASAPPFVGTFRPQGSLANYIFNGTPNGSWKLRVADANGGTFGTLRNWSLFLYPVACNAGGGNCDYCLPPVTNSITAGDLSQTNRLTRDVIVAGCGAPKVFPGAFPGSYHYDVYSFTNTTASDACVTVLLTAGCDVQAGVYLNAFDPVNIATNYLGDSGFSTAGGIPQSCSVTIPAGAKFIVTVNEVFSGTLCGGYTLQLSGLPCPDPTLAINKAAPTNSVRVNWPTSAGGYQLEALASLSKTNWAAVTNEPLVNAGRFNVTNSMNPTNAFYRLKKP